MSELFDDNEIERLPVADAELLLWRRVEFGDEGILLRQLIEETPWRSEHVTVWGKTYLQPRMVAWYGGNALSYSYSGIVLKALPWTPALLAIREKVDALCGVSFNSTLLNYYRDHRDSMGFHSDDEPELGPTPIIASVTFGETRPFVLKHKRRKDVKDIRLLLPSASLLLMRGATQANWRHGLPKLTQPCGPRVNLTFRQILR